MSQWTHVAGIIRLDALAFLGGNIEKELQNAFGNSVNYEDSEDKWYSCNVPCGSEGSLEYSIQKTAHSDSQLAWGVLYIWGDLRDYQDQNKIYDWVKESIGKLQSISVRSCNVKIDVEYHGSYLVYDLMDDETFDTNILMIEIK